MKGVHVSCDAEQCPRCGCSVSGKPLAEHVCVKHTDVGPATMGRVIPFPKRAA